MGKNELSLRANWQEKSGHLSNLAEKNFNFVFTELFSDTGYEIISRPKEFSRVYENWALSKKDKEEIYNPQASYRHGFIPDYSIVNLDTQKKIFVEVKRQDGWVEGKHRSAGRGNAHERLCKYFTPGLMKLLASESKITSSSLPFWIVFVGDITRDPCRVREITCWFDKYESHFFFWRSSDATELVDHFINRIAPLLE